MKTYYLRYIVSPTTENQYVAQIEGAYAHCWIKARDPQVSVSKSIFLISKFDWKIIDLDEFPIEVGEDFFLSKDIGLEQFKKAQVDGVSICYTAWANKDRKTTVRPFIQSPSYNFDVGSYLSKQKQFKNSKRCLHYDAGESCNNVIRAHSIQRKGSLTSIEESGKAYTISRKFSNLKANGGRITFEKQGVEKQISTFFGFCKYHDNLLFKPIDDTPLLPTEEQVTLYAYRSICKELFVKKNSYNLTKSQLGLQKFNQALIEMYETISVGTKFGLESLKNEKQKYDLLLKNKMFHRIEYALFLSSQKPNIVFSGVFFPEYDFLGRHLQNLGNLYSRLDLLTFCSAKTKEGWGFLFAWHEDSSKSCAEFIRSLATMVHENNSIGDFLFRLVISNCENLAISPKWWESLTDQDRMSIEERISSMADIFSLTRSNYLSDGIANICSWSFEKVITNME